MAEGRDDCLSIRIDDDCISTRVGKKLRALPLESFECSIFKVPIQLGKENDEAYEPQILAIGPYHRGKDRLKAMEGHKIRYLQKLLQRRNENNVTRYVVALMALEERARKCYSESISINSDDFVEMMLLDGCFIVELIRKYTMEELSVDNDPIFKGNRILYSLKRDMLLLENQLPFFVLLELFGMTVMPNQQEKFTKLIYDFFDDISPGSSFEPVDNYSIERIQHLLSFIHESWHHSLQAVESNVIVTDKGKWSNIRCATELQEAGIKFSNVEGNSMFDITFENGIMEIPPIRIEDRTESFLRNLVAYEQCSLDEIPIYVLDYIVFMDCLINTSKDVELLVRCGIIINDLGDDEVVAKMVNKLCNSVVLSGGFHYSEVCEEVNNHCSQQWNIWKANLRHNYFNSPWAFISFLAAAVLLLFTLTQTIYTVLPYYKKKS